MASADALDALEKGSKAWSDYQSTVSGKLIDLTMANLSDRNFSGFTFSQCNLDGAKFTGATLDKAQFVDCTLRETILSRVSAVDTRLVGVDAAGADFQGAIARRARFEKIVLDGANCEDIQLELSDLISCSLRQAKLNRAILIGTSIKDSTIEDIDLDQIQLSRCSFSRSVLHKLQIRSSIITATKFSKCDLTAISLHDGQLADTAFDQCSLLNVELLARQKSNLDFSGCTFRNIDLQSFDLPGANFIDVTVINCKWPLQSGRTSLLGHYTPSPHLLGHPVQDLRGIPPILRREIADAQYLRDLHILRPGLLKSTIYRVWGATTAFGTSLTRLSILTLLSIALLSGAILTIDHTISWSPPVIQLFSREFLVVSQNLFGISQDQANPSSGESLLLPSARLLGFIVLGLWIGLAANRLGRLSSE